MAKTMYLLEGKTESLRTRFASNVAIDGDEFRVVKEFAYLGSLVTRTKLQRRFIITGSRAYYGLHMTLRSGNLF